MPGAMSNPATINTNNLMALAPSSKSRKLLANKPDNPKIRLVGTTSSIAKPCTPRHSRIFGPLPGLLLQGLLHAMLTCR